MNNQEHRKRPASFFGPVLLICLGLVFLIHNLGILPGTVWDTVLKLWPALLILAGLDDLLRGEGVVWPSLLIAGGTFLLLNNFGPQSWISWSQLLQLWPVLLIALGIDLVFRSGPGKRSGWVSAVGVILTLVLVAGAGWWLGADQGRVRAGETTLEIAPDQMPEAGQIQLGLNAGQLILSGVRDEDVFAAGTILADDAEQGFEVEDGIGRFELKSGRMTIFPGTASWELGFSEDLPLDMDIENGAGQLFLALEDLALDELDVEQGAGETVIRLPARDQLEVRVDQAVGRIQILVPRELGLRVEAERALSSLQLPPDFTRSGAAYFSPGYREAEHQVLLIIEQAVGLIEIRFTE